MPTARGALGVAVVNGLIYAIGGIASWNSSFNVGTSTATVEIYNPSSNSWSTGVPLPQPLDSFGVAVSNGTIYVIAGESKGNVVNTVYSFNPATSTSWSTMSNLPLGRQSLGAVANSTGLIFAVGGMYGLASNPVTTAETDVYNPATNSWSTLSPMPSPAYGMAVVDVVAGSQEAVQVLDGFNSNNAQTNPVWAFNYSQYSVPGTFYVFVKD